MKKNKVIVSFLVLCFLLVGCFTTDNKTTESKNKAKIELVNTQISSNNTTKLDTIGQLAYGTGYALSKVTNQPPIREVEIAKTMNDRVLSITGTPTVEKMKEMQIIIDNLRSTLTNEVKKGKLLLDQKDKEISAVQDESKILLDVKDKAIAGYITTAEKTAAIADEQKLQLDKMNKWFGLGAVVYGLKHFAIRMAWILGIGGVLFLIIRLAAESNPIAAAIFGVFDHIGAWFINTIDYIFPKAVTLAGNTTTEAYDALKGTVTKVVDEVQMAKNNAIVAGKPADLQTVFDNLEKTMTPDEKAIIDEIKKALNWS